MTTTLSARLATARGAPHAAPEPSGEPVRWPDLLGSLVFDDHAQRSPLSKSIVVVREMVFYR